MMPETMIKRASLVVAGTGLLLVALVLVVHTPQVRRAVLRRAVLTLQERLDLVLRADSLSYNLAVLRISLDNVTLAAVRAPEAPFARVDRITIDVPWSAVFGPFSVQEISLENARVDIVRRGDGTTNLPSPSTTANGEPSPLPIDHLRISSLAITVSDEPASLNVGLPPMAVDLSPDRGTIRSLANGTNTNRAEVDAQSDTKGCTHSVK